MKTEAVINPFYSLIVGTSLRAVKRKGHTIWLYGAEEGYLYHGKVLSAGQVLVLWESLVNETY